MTNENEHARDSSDTEGGVGKDVEGREGTGRAMEGAISRTDSGEDIDLTSFFLSGQMGGYFPAYGAGGYPAAVAAQLAAAQQSSQVRTLKET